MTETLTISQILKQLMFKQGIKTAELARLTKLPQPTVHRIVEGDSTRPHKNSLIAIANFFNLTLEQINGQSPIPELSPKVETKIPDGWYEIPVYNWDDITNFAKSNKTQVQKGITTTLTNADVDDKGFVVELDDASMYPQFPIGTEIVINTQYEPMDREMVIVYLKKYDKAFFRMLIFNGTERLTRPLNPDLINIGMEKLNLDEDVLVGVFIEERKKARRTH